MAQVLYIDACAGLSGDMAAGALLELGWPIEELRGLVQRLGLDRVSVSRQPVDHLGLAAGRLQVTVAGDQPHRHLAGILALLERLPPAVAAPAARVFDRLAEAEAAVHGVAASEVHFHEVGAADALVDVVAFCAGLAWLGSPRLVCSPLPLGRGFVDCAHGRLPLPAPAVSELLRGVPVVPWPADEETVTPTGAALAVTLADSFGPLPAMTLRAVGVGGGSRASSVAPNVCRLFLGEAAGDPAEADQVVEIVCHLDDQSPEDLPVIIEGLLAAGALDAAAGELLMKKGRPGLALTVLAAPADADRLAAMVLAQTTSLGVRLRPCQRRLLPRRMVTVDSPWGPVRVKQARVAGRWRSHPEADDVAAICRKTGLAPHQVRARVLKELG